jgi:hypothetical protein
LVRDLDLGENVIIMTERLGQADMAKLYNCADLLTVTSRTDLFPSCHRGHSLRGAGGDLVRPRAEERHRGPGRGSDDIVRAAENGHRPPVPPRGPCPPRHDGLKARELALKDFSFDVGADRLVSIYSEGM